METYEAIYDHGKLKFKEKPKIQKAKVLVTFLTNFEKKKIKFPVKSLGKIKIIDRDKLYGNYLSDRYLYSCICL